MKAPANRSIYNADNLSVLRAFPDSCIDLIYLDPPFNTRKEQRTEFYVYDDAWSMHELDAMEHGQFAAAHPDLYAITQVAQTAQDSHTKAYLIMMALRLVELHRVLKPTGSLYLHCDPKASHYLKIMLDTIFGMDDFRNEIIWARKQDTHNLATKQCGRAHDVILWYAMSDATKYNKQFTDYSEDYIKSAYKHKDKNGTYRTLPCTNDAGGNRPYEFKGITRAWRFTKSRMQQMYDDNLLVQATPTSPFQYKKYLDYSKGVPVQDLWLDINAVRGKKENLGYPTQKPIALLERIIKASSNEGDLVLDPFCGCATACVAAERLNRQWVGIDLIGDTYDLIVHRVTTLGETTEQANVFFGAKADKCVRKFDGDGNDITPDNIDKLLVIRARQEAIKKKRQVKKAKARKGSAAQKEIVANQPTVPKRDIKLTSDQTRHYLYGRQDGNCNGCRTQIIYKWMRVDCIKPLTAGGKNKLDNMQLLCKSCQSLKGDGTHKELITKLKEAGLISGDFLNIH